MSSTLTARPLWAPGQLVVDPDVVGGRLSGDVDTNFGGTRIGLVAQSLLVIAGEAHVVESEALGEPSDVLEANNRYAWSAFLRGWDDDAVRLLLPGYSEGDSGHAVYSVPGNTTPGQSAMARARRFLFVPDDHVNAPAVLLFNGVPDWNQGAQLAMNRRDELGIPLSILAMRSASGDTLKMGRLRDL